MRLFTFLCLIGCLWLPSSPAVASAPPAGKPSIRIVSPANNATITGSTVTVRVAVTHFKLVPPVLVGPNHWKSIPLLKGNQGHIHYLLDGAANLVLTRDVVVRTTHTWTNVSPGRHTITAYLANSQHAAFPGAAPAVIHITVKPSSSQQPQTSSAQTPSVSIVQHRVEQTPAGTRLLIRVHVAHFKLIPPVYKNPPLLPNTEGHIHYALDSVSNFIATQSASASLSHPWTNVSPGRHTIIVYLSTSQHQLVPGTRPASVTIDVPRGNGPQGQTALFVGPLPKTGGGEPSSTPGPGLAFLEIALALLLIVGGLAVWRRTAAL
jgi:hypothetical protein